MEQVKENNRTMKETVNTQKQQSGDKFTKQTGGVTGWWKEYYVYIISSFLIVAVMLTVLALKHFWPFGKAVLLNGDYVSQTWPFLCELKEKIISGENWAYTWNSGSGTNFISIISFGMINPMLLILLLVPNKMMLQAGTIIYILTLVGMNCSMLYFLSHRPHQSMPQNKIASMLFSMAYALCIYVISNANIWYFMVCGIFFPLILLGLENFVANKGWKLYFVSLALAFISNYYFAGLFCVFIILYYLTLEFGSFKLFLRKSLKILGISIAAVGVSSVLLLPTAVQMMNQDYTTSSLNPGVWFTTYFDIFKNFLVFNNSIGAGSSMTSYGEVSLYYGLLPLMLTSFYFLNPKIKRSVRLKKLFVLVLYLLAFNLNVLNYVMHLFHYPTWYPNRFSLFFTLYCLVLAYESWVTMERTDFKYVTVLRGVILGVAWAAVTVVCFAFAKKIDFQFTYYYSIMIFMFYMVAMLLLPYLKGKEARVLAVIGCVELVVSFWYTAIFRSVAVSLEDINSQANITEEFIKETDIQEANGFSRVLDAKVILNTNSGMRFGLKTTSLFASSIGNSVYFYTNVGISSGGNTIWNFTYTPVTLSMLNIQYILFDDNVSYAGRRENIYTSSPNVYEHYPVFNEKDDIYLYENPTVLSVGYMIDSEAENIFGDNLYDYKTIGINCSENVNQWVESACGVSDVFEPIEFTAKSIEANNCRAGILNNNLLISKESVDGIDMNKEGALFVVPEAEYDEALDSYVAVVYEAEEAGEYVIQLGNVMTTTGYLEAGEEFALIRHISYNAFADCEYEANKVLFYRLNEEQWQKAYEELSKQQLEVTEYDSDTVKGNIHVEEDGIFFTSIPYDQNWHIYVDGEEVDVLPLWNESFVAAKLSAGDHEIRLEYKQKGMWLGIFLSVGSVLLTLGYALYARKYKKDYLLESEALYEGCSLDICYSEEELERRKNKKRDVETMEEESIRGNGTEENQEDEA